MVVIQEDKFYDRCSELRLLKEKYDGLSKGEFGVLYGRRRLGKSKLLRKFLSKISTKKIYVEVIDANRKDFMRTLSNKIEETYNEIVQINRWSDFFGYIVEKSKSESLVLVIDEFQRLNSFAKDFILLYKVIGKIN